MAVVLDAGALIAVERGRPEMADVLRAARIANQSVVVPTAVVAQVWRDGARQARVARLLDACEELALTDTAARRVGRWLAAAGTVDVVDGSVIDAAHDGDIIITSDPADIAHLAAATGKIVRLITM